MVNITNINKDTSKQAAAIKCILSDVTKQSIEMSIADMLKDCPTKKDVKYMILTCDYQPGELDVCVVIDDEDCYDWMMTKKECYINSDVNVRLEKTMVFVSHQFTKLNLKVLVHTNLKDEDFRTLDMLGKVHRELIPSSVSESIYCEL